jgi:hypothetical protein
LIREIRAPQADGAHVEYIEWPLIAEEERIARLAKQIGDDIRKDQHLLLTDSEVLDFVIG